MVNKNNLKTFMYENFDKNSDIYKTLFASINLSFNQDEDIKINDEDIHLMLFISHEIGNKPFTTQENIFNLIKKEFKVNLTINDLLELNKNIRNNELCQNLIINYSIGSKYWKNTIVPICESGGVINTIEKKPVHPYRIGIYPGLSCMFECVFCGRNYNAKYDRSLLDDGMEKYISLINSSPKEDEFKFYISGGLEPLTNPKLNILIKEIKKNGFKVPLYTNGQMLTEKFIKKSDFIKDLYSLRISLYGTNEQQYSQTVRKKNQFDLVKNNIVNLINHKNKNNLSTLIGLNYILLDGRGEDMLKILEFIKSVNKLVGNKKNNINFLTLREDFRSTTNLRLKKDERIKLVDFFRKFQQELDNNKEFENLFVDYGYSLEPIKDGYVDHIYEDVFADENILLKEGTPNISVAIDLYGDVYGYREAAFLDRPGSKRYILGRIEDNISINDIIDKSVKLERNIEQHKNDLDYLDAFDHIVLRTLNQAKEDKNFGIPFEKGPVKSRIFDNYKKTINFKTHFSDTVN